MKNSGYLPVNAEVLEKFTREELFLDPHTWVFIDKNILSTNGDSFLHYSFSGRKLPFSRAFLHANEKGEVYALFLGKKLEIGSGHDHAHGYNFGTISWIKFVGPIEYIKTVLNTIKECEKLRIVNEVMGQ